MDWGLGSSSSLVYCIAQWADANPYELYWRTFGGSGYDIACAKASGPIHFKLNEDEAVIQTASLDKKITNHIYFIYTGKKQNTAESVAEYRSINGKTNLSAIKDVSQISEELPNTKSLSQAESLFSEHENIISKIIKQPPVKSSFFPDYWGSIKSLGAWGGDFILATSDRPLDETKSYFEQKGLDVFFKWDQLAH
jgi:hypothetical protein